MYLGNNNLLIIQNTMNEHLGFFLIILLIIEGIYLASRAVLQKKLNHNLAIASQIAAPKNIQNHQ